MNVAALATTQTSFNIYNDPKFKTNKLKVSKIPICTVNGELAWKILHTSRPTLRIIYLESSDLIVGENFASITVYDSIRVSTWLSDITGPLAACPPSTSQTSPSGGIGLRSNCHLQRQRALAIGKSAVKASAKFEFIPTCGVRNEDYFGSHLVMSQVTWYGT